MCLLHDNISTVRGWRGGKSPDRDKSRGKPAGQKPQETAPQAWLWLDSAASLLSKTRGSDLFFLYWGFFSGRSDGKEPTCQCKRHRLKPWVGRSPGGGQGNPLQDSWSLVGYERLTFCTIRVVRVNIINREAHTEDGNPNGNLEFRVSQERGAFKGVRPAASRSVSRQRLRRALQYSRTTPGGAAALPKRAGLMTQHTGSVQLPLYTGLPSPPAQKNFFLDVSILRCSISWAGFRGLQAGNQGFPGSSVVKNLPAQQETQIPSLGFSKIPREWQPTPVFLPGESHGQ